MRVQFMQGLQQLPPWRCCLASETAVPSQLAKAIPPLPVNQVVRQQRGCTVQCCRLPWPRCIQLRLAYKPWDGPILALHFSPILYKSVGLQTCKGEMPGVNPLPVCMMQPKNSPTTRWGVSTSGVAQSPEDLNEVLAWMAETLQDVFVTRVR